jgi:hypothetical protein
MKEPTLRGMKSKDWKLLLDRTQHQLEEIFESSKQIQTILSEAQLADRKIH